MSTSTKLMSCHHIPDAIIEEILLRLPLKSIIRFRCVCKKWCIISKSSHFVDTHHVNNEERMLVKHVVFRDRNSDWNIDPEDKKMFLALYKDYSSFSLVEPSLPPLLETEVPCYYPGNCLVGYCKGVICMIDCDDVVLLNPVLRERKILTLQQYDRSERRSYMLGFGFDDVNRAFKVVIIQFIVKGETLEPIAEVYNFSTCSWKVLDSISVDLQDEYKSPSIFFNGFIHWCGYNDIFKFNTAKDLCERMKFPQGVGLDSEPNTSRNMFTWNHCIALVLFHYMEFSAKIWIMETYGVEESWKKLYHISTISDPISDWEVCIKKLLCFWSDDKLLYEATYGNIFAYDFTNKSASRISNIEVPSSYENKYVEILSYKESLFSLNV